MYFMLYLSAPGSSSEEGQPIEEGSNYPGWRDQEESPAGGRKPGNIDRTTEERDRWMEERKTKALKLLSKLQDDKHQLNAGKGHSNFEDCEFII